MRRTASCHADTQKQTQPQSRLFFSFFLSFFFFLSFGPGSTLFAFVEERGYTGSSCRGVSSEGVGAVSQTPHHFRQCSRVHESNNKRFACVWSADCVWRMQEMPSLVRILPVTQHVSVILMSHSNTQSTQHVVCKYNWNCTLWISVLSPNLFSRSTK